MISEMPSKPPRNVRFAEDQWSPANQLDQESDFQNSPITKDDSLHFFTQVWDNVENAEGAVQLGASGAEIGSSHRTARLPKAKQPLVGYLSPLYTDSKQAGNILYYPSASRPAMKSHLDTGPVQSEESGLYVGNRPKTNVKNQNTMEQRVVKERSLNWIGDDWRLKTIPDPVTLQGTRCSVHHEMENQDDFVKEGVPILSNALLIRSSVPRRLELAVEILSLEFRHHYLFSLEHVLANRLQESYKGYQTLLQENGLRSIKDRINGLKLHLTSLQKQVENGLTHDTSSKLQECLEEIISGRQKYDQTARFNRAALIHLIEIWANLKVLRSRNGFTCTPYQLILHTKRKNKVCDLDRYQRDIEDELSEREMLFMLIFRIAQQKYSEQMSYWEVQHAAWNHARDVVEEAQGNSDPLPADIVALAKLEEPRRPVAPEQFDSRAVTRLIEDRVVESRRPPGDSDLVPELKKDTPISESASCSAAERARRTEVERARIFLRVVVNDEEVCRTPAHALTDDFMLIIAKKIYVVTEYIPRKIKVEVFEEQGFANRMLAETLLAVPDENFNERNAPLETVEFASADRVTSNNAGVGSGVPVKIGTESANQPVRFFTNGSVRCRTAWTVESARKILVSRQGASGLDALDALGARGIRDVKKLAQWVQSAKLDPNDPAYADLMYYVKELEQTSDTKFFRLEQLQQEFDFTTADAIAQSKRFRLIQLRDKLVPEFANLKMIPANEDEISPQLLAKYEARKRREATSLLGGADARQRTYAGILQNLREHISATIRSAQGIYTYEDLVHEDPVLSFGGLFAALARWWKPKHPLKPVRTRRKQIPLTEASHGEMRLIIRILRANSLPCRSSAAELDQRPNPAVLTPLGPSLVNPPNTSDTAVIQIDSHTTQLKKDEKPLLRALSTVSFGGQEGRLQIVEGPDPVWNGQMTFRLNPTSKSSLDFLRQKLDIQFYDEVAVDVLQDSSLRETHVHQRLDKRWLGSLHVSFSSLYVKSKFEGTFPLSTPPVLLGYSPVSSATGSATSTTPTASIFIALDPPLIPPRPFLLTKLESLEKSSVIENAESWATSLRKQFPDRSIRPLVVNTEAKSCLITRFIRPLNPPSSILTDTTITRDKMVSLARFVSLIPSVSDTLLFPEAIDIWTTNDQFLNLQCGDDEEHALLLLSYFLYFKVSAYILIGETTAGGPGAFVISKLQTRDDFTLWDATAGKSYKVTSSECPVSGIGMIADASNVFANVQPHNAAHEIQWQLTKASHWKPLWTTQQAKPPDLYSLQPESFAYDDTPPHTKHELEVLLSNRIIAKIVEDRSRYATRWNIECNRRLYRLLETMEVDANKADVRQYHEHELRDLSQLYNIYGFPMNVTYSAPDDLVDTVTATGIHKIESHDVELSLAVNVIPYSHSVVSVWVYLAVLTRKQ